MKNHDFNALYTRVFEDPLLALGFARVGRGKSLKHLEDGRDLRILRLRGRFARPGTIRTVIVFRHSVLRPVRSDDPGLETLDVSDFPRKLTFYDFSGDS
ncbi:hypothetical protein [Ovoidimarina sediminis]|uniref:hypothetical protein n=1 Tax=Ovoidimarina sediminis TaxID=3079856 RepID=UPI002911755A|nr:hypothetical protein [Rhodophyticola sp. MJ-SS7]MDU8941962.1 hypothetical protein [Rhodophyticola sp. MJ-SS7]